MALKIRFRQQGRKNRLQYRLVVVDSRARRDGKYVESIGWYNPVEPTDSHNSVFIKPDRLQHWLDHGAQLTEKAEALMKNIAPEVMGTQAELLKKKREKLTQKRREKRKKQAETAKAE